MEQRKRESGGAGEGAGGGEADFIFQSVLAAFADARGPLLVAIKEVATACQGCAGSWGTKEAQGNILASIEARKIRQTDTWMSMEFDAGRTSNGLLLPCC